MSEETSYIPPRKLKEVKQLIVSEFHDDEAKERGYKAYRLSDGRVLIARTKPAYDALIGPDLQSVLRPKIPNIPRKQSIFEKFDLAEFQRQDNANALAKDALELNLELRKDTLDFSRQSLSPLERAIRKQKWTTGTESEKIVSLLSYFGETLRLAVHGDWEFRPSPENFEVPLILSEAGNSLDFVMPLISLLNEGKTPHLTEIFDWLVSRARG